MCKVKVESKSKLKCCVSQRTGIKCIAVLSSLSGMLILIMSTLLIMLKSGDGNNNLASITKPLGLDPVNEAKATTQGKNRDDTGRRHPVKNWSKYIFMEPQTIAIMQIFSSLCLFSSHREIRKFSIIWIIFHIFGIVINIAYLWKLPAWVTTGEALAMESSVNKQHSIAQASKMYTRESFEGIAEENNKDDEIEYFSTLTRFLLDFIGINLCIEIFSILVLIEFLRCPEPSRADGDNTK